MSLKVLFNDNKVVSGDSARKHLCLCLCCPERPCRMRLRSLYLAAAQQQASHYLHPLPDLFHPLLLLLFFLLQILLFFLTCKICTVIDRMIWKYARRSKEERSRRACCCCCWPPHRWMTTCTRPSQIYTLCPVLPCSKFIHRHDVLLTV